MHSYCSYALLWTPIFMLSQYGSIENPNEFVIKWCGIHKILCQTSKCEWLFMTHSLAILALMTTGIDLITPESSSYLYCSFSILNIFFVNPISLTSVMLGVYTLWLQQTRIAESEVLHMILRNWLLTLLQNHRITGYHKYRVSIRLVYRIRRFIFIHYQQQTQFETL